MTEVSVGMRSFSQLVLAAPYFMLATPNFTLAILSFMLASPNTLACTEMVKSENAAHLLYHSQVGGGVGRSVEQMWEGENLKRWLNLLRRTVSGRRWGCLDI